MYRPTRSGSSLADFVFERGEVLGKPFKVPGVDVKCQQCFYWLKKCTGLAKHSEVECKKKLEDAMRVNKG